MLAGRLRSTDFPHVYTLRIIKTLVCCHQLVKVFQDACDISSLVVGKPPCALRDGGMSPRPALPGVPPSNSCSLFAKVRRGPGHPEHPGAKNFARIMSRHEMPMHAERQGIDIGVDTASALTTATGKQSKRIQSTKGKAKRCGSLARRNAKVRRVAMLQIDPSQA